MYIIFKMYYIGLALVKMLSNEWNEKWKRQKKALCLHHGPCLVL